MPSIMLDFHSVHASPRLLCARIKNEHGNHNIKDNASILTLGSISWSMQVRQARSTRKDQSIHPKVSYVTYGLKNR